jgi:DNA-directed RNA polymerase subunit N (RpoN/RPB10)
MLIPIKCFTCGNVLANKYNYFITKVKVIKDKLNYNKNDAVVYLTMENTKKTPEGIVLDELKLRKICCRRHMLTHVDIE